MIFFPEFVEENKFFTLGERPFQVAIMNATSKEQECSGSIVAPSYVLTAKHCFENLTLSDLMVGLIFNYYKPVLRAAFITGIPFYFI
jgi:Trypsin